MLEELRHSEFNAALVLRGRVAASVSHIVFRVRWIILVIVVLWLGVPGSNQAQTLDVHESIRSYDQLNGTVVTLRGRAELHLTGTGDPLVGSMIHLGSSDAWLFLSRILPSRVASDFLNRVRVMGAPAVHGVNVRVVQYGEGTVVIPHGVDFAPLQVFAGRLFAGATKRLNTYEAYDENNLGKWTDAIGSFRLQRGYMATFAQMADGSGVSRCYVAQDGDLEVDRLPAELENNVRFVRVFPWRWVSKKGIAGNIESGLNVQWLYNWNLNRTSPLDWEYVPIRQIRWWPSLDQDWRVRGATHVLGYNEPDHPDQANLNVEDAIWSWPDLLRPGLRVGAPAVSDGGLSWLYDFMEQADAAGLRVDFVPVHYYRCFGNAGDPNGAANQFYNFLKGIHDVVRRPLWITEWNNGANWTGCADPNFEQQRATVQAILDMLDRTPFVERYAIYNWVEDVRRVKWDDGSLTDAGVVYRDQKSPLAYRQEMPETGAGASGSFPFDGDTRDASGNGQTVMRVGAPHFVPGRHGQAMQLNGSTDFLQLSPHLGDSEDWSFTGWIYWNGGSNWQRVFDLGEGTSRYLFLTPSSASDTLRFAIKEGGNEQRLEAARLPVGNWTHVAVTIAGGTGKLFVNGQLADTNPNMTYNPSDVGTQFNFLGKSQWPTDPLFGGKLDDIRFYYTALSDAQVASIVSTPPPRFLSPVLRKPDALVQQPYSGSLTGDVIGSGLLLYGKMAGPAWLSVALNGNLTGTPGPFDGGLNRFVVRVRGANESFHMATLEIHVPFLEWSMDANDDDAEQSSAGAVTLDSSDLELVRDTESGAGTQIVGLRFDGVPIPQGAIITNAFIQFTADESQSEVTSLTISVEDTDHAPMFASTANNLGGRPLSSLRVPWQPPAWVAGQSGLAQRTPNLAGLVQDIISRPGWTDGNALAFLFSGSGHRTAESHDKAGGVAARLIVNYVPPSPATLMAATVTHGADDAEESEAGAVTLNSTDLELMRDDAVGPSSQTVGIRFQNVILPPDAILADAHLQFSADEIASEQTALIIHGQADSDAGAFTADINAITSRPTTIDSVAWSPAAWTTTGERGPQQRTPDLSGIVREIVGQPGWSSGNAMVFLLGGTGLRTAESADKVGGRSATLEVNYWSELPRGTFESWAVAQAVDISPDGHGDGDGDGYDDLFEYALGLNPGTPNQNAIDVSLEGLFLHVVYTRPVFVSDVRYRIEWSDTLGTVWNDANVTQEILADDGIQRTLRAIVFRGFIGRRFVRLRVSK